MKRNVLIVVLFSTVLLLGARTVIDLTRDVSGILPTVNGGAGKNQSTVTALGTTGTVNVDMSLGMVYTITPTGTVTLTASNCASGREATIVVTTSGTTSFTMTPSTNLKGTALLTGTTTGKTFGWTFVCNGTTGIQVGAATAAM